MLPQEDALFFMERLRTGDGAALAGLYDHLTPLLYPVALRIVGSPSDAEDVVQQAWIQAWKRADTYDPQRGSVAAWLVTIVRSRALDRTRSAAARERAETAPEGPAPAAPPDPSARLERVQRHETVRAALERLDPRHKDVLELAFFGGLSQTQIAKRLDTPLGTVKTWARRGLLRLRELLAGEEGQS